MSVILILMLASLAVALVFLGCFIWAVRAGQFDDTVTPGMRVLMDERGAANSDLQSVSRLPLTLGLSRREREQPSDGVGSFAARSAISDPRNPSNRRTIPPLPPAATVRECGGAEEGRGEGEESEVNPRPASLKPTPPQH